MQEKNKHCRKVEEKSRQQSLEMSAHKQNDMTVKSEKLRYENADEVYED